MNHVNNSIILGRAGVHHCYHNNLRFLRKSLDLLDEDIPGNKDTEIFSCSLVCKFKTWIRMTIYVFIVISNSYFFANKVSKLPPNVIIFSNPNRRFINSQLIDFMAENRIRQHLKNQDLRILVQAKMNYLDLSSENVKRCKSIPLNLMNNNLKLAEKSMLRKSVLKNFFELMKNNSLDPIKLCFKEYIFEIDLYKLINFEGVVDLIYTQSNLRKLSPISYLDRSKFLVNNVMIWYSSNNSVPNKINEKPNEYHESYLALDRIDIHLVWDETMKISLSKITNSPIYGVGSLLFYPNKKNIKKLETNIIKVVIFDVTPKNIFHESNFGHESQALQFLEDIIAVVKKIKLQSGKVFKLEIKIKRPLTREHSKKYVKYLKILERKKVVRLLKSTANLYDVVGGADLVICIPWTSPGLIAVELGVPCIYYVPDSEGIWELENTRKLDLCRTKSELSSLIKKHLDL